MIYIYIDVWLFLLDVEETAMDRGRANKPSQQHQQRKNSNTMGIERANDRLHPPSHRPSKTPKP